MHETKQLEASYRLRRRAGDGHINGGATQRVRGEGPRDRGVVPARRATLDAAIARSSRTEGLGARIPVVGYASSSVAWSEYSQEIRQQAALIRSECRKRGLETIELVAEREPPKGKALGRPGIDRALELLATRRASGLVVASLARLTTSSSELGAIIEWLLRHQARLVAVVPPLDTAEPGGRLAADVLIEVSRSERTRLSERTRSGLLLARTRGRTVGRPAVTDDPNLTMRIAEMRAQGMTLQAIADRLNEEQVPTVRGGAKWRHSSVQAAVGYRRPLREPGGRSPGDRRSSKERG